MEQQTHKQIVDRFKTIQSRKSALSESAEEYLDLVKEERELKAYAKAHSHRWLIESGEE